MTDFTAKLIDVYPPSACYPQGYALNLTDSIARLRYRNGRERGELVKPGEPVQVTLPLYPTSNLFMPGHRIRLDVSSSNFPRFDVNPNTGEAIGRERRRVVADNTVFHERGRESRVDVAAAPPHFAEAVLLEYLAALRGTRLWRMMARRVPIYPCAAWNCVTKTCSRRRSFISLGSAVSMKSATASFRLSRAFSIEVPWLATSSSGHKATYWLPSRSMIAVNTEPGVAFIARTV